MIKWAVKKYILGKLNALLEGNAQSVAEKRATIDKWLARLQCVITALSNISAYLADGEIDGEELDGAVAEIDAVVKAW